MKSNAYYLLLKYQQDTGCEQVHMLEAATDYIDSIESGEWPARLQTFGEFLVERAKEFVR
jgi:hypothetical protein